MPIPLQVPFLLVIFEGPKHCFCRVDRGRMVVTFQYAERQSLGMESSIEMIRSETFFVSVYLLLSTIVGSRLPASACCATGWGDSVVPEQVSRAEDGIRNSDCALWGRPADEDLSESLSGLLEELDGLVARREIFQERHQQRIDSLAEVLHQPGLSPRRRYELNSRMADCYFSYQSDSAIAYLHRNLLLARRMGDGDLELQAVAMMAYSLSLNGYFLEADRFFSELTDTLNMSPPTREIYYLARHRQYREYRNQMFYEDVRIPHDCEWYYARQAAVTCADPVFRTYFRFLLAMHEQHFDLAEAICSDLLGRSVPGTHDYAKAAYYRSQVEAGRGDSYRQLVWLVRAAMSDLQSAVRDYRALGAVAEELMRRGDIDRAMRYMRAAVDDTRIYNSPIRSWRDLAILPQIERAYSERNARLRLLYVVLFVVVTLFALTSVGGVLYVWRQNRRLHAVQLTLRQSNDKLGELMRDLRETNGRLSRQNIRIADANRIKEVYIGGFLMTISEYINKLADTYRYVNKMLRDDRVDELRRVYARQNVRNDELKEFYALFDTKFLELFPTFIDEFNALLVDEARVEVRRAGSLTTELRIFALMRLGVDDSATIASLLQCSVNTVYNYRSRMRMRMRDTSSDFEQQILSIGIRE